jgi:hypothetical protein
MAGYIYNPAESIRQDFQQAQSGLGNIFTQIIQQKQRDYTLAENTFANIEALKKDVNIYGQKSISSKANALLGNASQAILANGKLDYNKIGEIRQAVSDIKDLKTGYDLAAKEYEKALQLGVGSKDDLLSFQKYYSELGGIMSDENLIKNPRDLQVAFSKVYNSNLDGGKRFVNVFKTIAPYNPIEKQITNSKGGITDIKGEIPKNWIIGEDGRVSMPKTITLTNPDGTTREVPYLAQVTAELKAKDPTLIPLLREQNKFAATDLSDEQIAEYYLMNQVKVGVSAKESRSKSQIDMDASKAKTEGIQAKYAEDVIKADLAAKRASTNANLSQAAYYNTQRDLLQNPGSDGYYYDEKGKPVLSFEKPPKIDLALKGSGNTQRVVASELFYDANGSPRLAYYVPKGGESVDDLIKNGMTTGIRKEVVLPKDLAKSETYYKLVTALGGKTNARSRGLLKGFPSLPSMPTTSTALPGTGKRIDKASLGTMYGTGKPYQSEAEAAGAAKALGYTVDGY